MEKVGTLKVSFHLIPSIFIYVHILRKTSHRLKFLKFWKIEIFHAGSCASHVLALAPKNLFIVQFLSLPWRLDQAFLLWCLLTRLQPAHPIELKLRKSGFGIAKVDISSLS